MTKLTCLAGTYNEAARLPSFLTHATRWADEVVIVDKASTDATAAIASAAGATVHHRPFTPQGHEDMRDRIHCATHDWVFLMTPGEVPTRELITRVRAALDAHGGTVDIITIPKKLYSFGIHDPASPWSIGQQPMLIHRQRAEISNQVHANFRLRPGRQALNIPYSETCHVYHPTHATAESFIRTHTDYILAELAGCPNPAELYERAMQMVKSQTFGGHKPALRGQQCAWIFYWMGCALAAWEKQQGHDIPAAYARHTRELLARDWGEDGGELRVES